MSFERRWLLDKRVYYIKFMDVVTLDDIELISHHHNIWESITDNLQMHYIVDTTRVKQYPRNVREINNHIVGRMSRTGWVMLITNDFFIHHLTDLFGQLCHFNVKTTGSVREGYRFLQSVEEIPAPQNWPDNLNDTMPLRGVN